MKAAKGYPSNNSLASMKQLSARLKRKTLNLNEKIKLIDYAKKNPSFGCLNLGVKYTELERYQLQAC